MPLSRPICPASRLFVPLFVCLAATALLGSRPVSAAQVGTLLSRSGSCSVKHAAATAFAVLYEHNPLYAADVVQTGDGSKGTILFNEGSQLLMNSDTSVTITGGVSGGGGLFHLVRGEVFARLRPGAAASTDSAIAAVRGTVFDLVADADGGSHITVTEGIVHFYNQFGAVEVAAGEHSDVVKGQAPTKPVTVGQNDLQFEWTLDLDRSFVTREAGRLTTGDLHALAASAQVAATGAGATAASHRDYGDVFFDQHQYTLALAQYQLAPQDPDTDIRTGNALLALDRIADADVSFAAAGQVPAALVGRAWVALRRQQPAQAQALAEQALTAGGVTLAQALPGLRPPLPKAEGLLSRRIESNLLPPARPTFPLRGHLPPATVGGTNRPAAVYDAAYETVLSSARWRDVARDAEMDAPISPSSVLTPLASGGLLPSSREEGVPAPRGEGGSAGTWAAADTTEESGFSRGVAAEAELVRGLALMREGGKDDAARKDFAAITVEPFKSQGLSWLAILELRAGDGDAALRDGRLAAAALPDSAVTHGNLALVCFFTDKASESRSEARKAANLDPDSAAAQIALGQADLAIGHNDEAARAGARAVALDPTLAEAWYLEGLADAARGDLVHARRELEQCTNVDPNFIPASAALARVLNKEGHPGQAADLLTKLLQTHDTSPDAHAALGLVLYEQGKYRESVSEYKRAAMLAPNSALIHAGYARVLLDDNQLNDAIVQAQASVHLAPENAQYHALLGLCYSFGIDPSFTGPDAEGQREFREALAIDPTNSLSRFELGLETYSGTGSDTQLGGVSPVDLSAISDGSFLFAEPSRPKNGATVLNSITQAALFDPAVSDQIMQGGVKTELNPTIADKGNQSVLIDHRDSTDAGKMHAYAQYLEAGDRVAGDHSYDSQGNLLAYATFAPSTSTTIAGTVVAQSSNQEIPPYPSTSPFVPGPISDASHKSIGDLASLSVKQEILGGTSLWLGIDGIFTRDNFVFPIPAYPYVNSSSGSVSPEVRLDVPISRDPSGVNLTFGAARSPQDVNTALQSTGEPGFTPAPVVFNPALHATTVYGQISQHITSHIFYTVLASREQLDELSNIVPSKQFIWLPRILIADSPDADTTLRFFSAREREDTTLLTFEPTETELSLEPAVLPTGDSNAVDVYELDAERYLKHGDFVKLFGFTSLSDQLIVTQASPTSDYAPTIQAGGVRRDGAGVRFEHAISRTLFGKITLVDAHTYNSILSSGADLATYGNTGGPIPTGPMPYQVDQSAQLGLDYVDRAGNKADVNVRYQAGVKGYSVAPGGPLGGSGQGTAPSYPDYPGEAYVDIRLAKEPSVNTEFYVQMINAFNSSTIAFNNLSTGGRETEAGMTLRF